MIVVILRIVAVMHGLVGIAFLIPLVIVALYSPLFLDPVRVNLLIHVFWIGIPAVGAVISFLMSYSLWGLRRWGHRLVLGVYSLCLAGVACGVIGGWMGWTPALIVAPRWSGLLASACCHRSGRR